MNRLRLTAKGGLSPRILAALVILSLPLLTLLVGGLLSRLDAADPTPTYGPGADAPCPERSPDGRFCAGVEDFSGLTVRAADGRRLSIPLWKWSRFLGWADDSRYAFVDNYDQYGNHTGLVVDTAAWEVWRPGLAGERACTASMSGTCRFGFALLAAADGLVLQETGVLVDLATRSGRPLFAVDEEMYVWPADLAPGGATIALFAGPRGKIASPNYAASLYLVDVAAAQAQAVAGLSLTGAQLSQAGFVWENGGERLRVTTSSGAWYLVDVATGRWTGAAQ